MVIAWRGRGSKRSRVFPRTLWWREVMNDVVDGFDHRELL